MDYKTRIADESLAKRLKNKGAVDGLEKAERYS